MILLRGARSGVWDRRVGVHDRYGGSAHHKLPSPRTRRARLWRCLRIGRGGVRLRRGAAQAPFGHNTETVVDTRVRDAWQVDASRVQLSAEWATRVRVRLAPRPFLSCMGPHRMISARHVAALIAATVKLEGGTARTRSLRVAAPPVMTTAGPEDLQCKHYLRCPLLQTRVR